MFDRCREMKEAAEAEGPPPRVTSRFIPLTSEAVIASLCRDVARQHEEETFARLALLLQRHRSHTYRDLAREIRRCYLPFSPDRDTVRVLEYSAEERIELGARLAEEIRHLLDRANYAPIPSEEIDRILNEESPYSLRISVDLSEYDQLHLFSREIYTRTYTFRRPETLYLLKARYEMRTFRRLFVFLKLKPDAQRAEEIAERDGIDLAKAERIVRRRRKQLPPSVSPEFVYIKVFKDMPENDLDILFPLRKVQFRPFDKLKFYATAGGGTLFGIFTTTGKVLAASNPFTLVGALFGFIALLARQISTFFNQRTRYMMELSQKLFFHNLANNRAALMLLIDRAEEEDVKEELIALYFHAGETIPKSALEARKAAIDGVLLERYGVAVDFEFADALSRLLADGVVKELGESLRFPTLAEAAERYARLADRDEAADMNHICDITAAELQSNDV